MTNRTTGTRRASKKKDFLAALIRTGYLPDEITPIITADSLAEFCRKHYDYLQSDQANLIRVKTQYDSVSIPRTTTGRRTLALVNPRSQVGICLVMTEHRSAIRKTIEENTLSLYDTAEDSENNGAFKGLNFRGREDLRLELYSRCPFILKADISRFFYTVYTHSIPWAVIGKEKAKELAFNDRKRLESHWSDKLDKALQGCQSRETFGIPVGPDTSRIVAELILAGVESDDEFYGQVSTRPKFRLLDDYEIGFDDEESAQLVLGTLRRSLWRFNLDLNDGKSGVVQSRNLIQDPWRREIETFRLRYSTPKKQREEVSGLVSLALQHCENMGDSRPAMWAIGRLSDVRKHDENSKMIVESVLRLTRDYPACARHAARFIVNNKKICSNSLIRTRVNVWIEETIEKCVAHGHDFELMWALFIAGVLRIHIGTAALTREEFQRSSIVFVVLGMLYERRLLSFPFSKLGWRRVFKKTGLYGPRWLPLYEAVRRKWTNDKEILKWVGSDPMLSRMLSENVTFLSDDLLDADRLDIRRTSSARPNTAEPGIDSEEEPGTYEFPGGEY